MAACIYCGERVTFWDRLFGNREVIEPGKVAHIKCRKEPKTESREHEQ